LDILKKLGKQKLFCGLVLLGAGIVFAFLHNLFFAFFSFEEPVLFLLCFLSLGIGVILLVWTVVAKVISWLKAGLPNTRGLKK